MFNYVKRLNAFSPGTILYNGIALVTATYLWIKPYTNVFMSDKVVFLRVMINFKGFQYNLQFHVYTNNVVF